MYLPDNEVRMGLLHDEFLRADMLLLPRVHDVTLLQELHGKSLQLITLQLDLLTQERGEHC